MSLLGSTYQISAALSITDSMVIEGQGGGRPGSRIVATVGGLTMLSIAPTAPAGNDGFGGSITGIELDGAGLASVGLSCTGLNTVKWAFSNINIVNCANKGAYLGGDHSLRFYNCQFSINGSDGVTDCGVQLDGANACGFFGCNAEANHGHGVLASAGFDNAWYGGAIEGNQLNGILGQGTAQHFSFYDIDFESNGLAAASYYDVNISTTNTSYWNLKNLNLVSAGVIGAIYNNGLQTTIDQCRPVGGPKIIWTINAANGLFIGDVANSIDPASAMESLVQVVNTAPVGFAMVQPPVPASATVVQNSCNGHVIVWIETPGDVSQVFIFDGQGAQIVMFPATPPLPGTSYHLAPGGSIKLAWPTTAPTWKWQQI